MSAGSTVGGCNTLKLVDFPLRNSTIQGNSTVDACCDLCNVTPRCQAFSFNKTNSTCFLKSFKPAARGNEVMISGWAGLLQCRPLLHLPHAKGPWCVACVSGLHQKCAGKQPPSRTANKVFMQQALAACNMPLCKSERTGSLKRSEDGT